MNRKVLVVDGNHSIYRSYFAVPNNMSATVDGKKFQTNACHGFFQILIRAVETLDVDTVVVSWDWGKSKKRTELHPEYKAGRQETPEELREQFPIVRELLKSLEVGQLGIKGEEGDDIVGCIAKLNTAAGDFTYVLSGDRDFLQLVNDKVNVVRPLNGGELAIYDSKKVEEEYGVRPDQYVDLMALRGDSSDNLPGVANWGQKTAAKYLQQYDTLENLLNHRDEIKGKVGDSLRDNWDDALMTQKMARINSDLAVEIDIPSCNWGTFTAANVREAFGKYRLTTVANKLLKHCRTQDLVDDIDVEEDNENPDLDFQGTLF